MTPELHSHNTPSVNSGESTAERNRQIRQMAKPNGTWSYAELAAEFNISKARVGQIVRGEIWLPKRLR